MGIYVWDINIYIYICITVCMDIDDSTLRCHQAWRAGQLLYPCSFR